MKEFMRRGSCRCGSPMLKLSEFSYQCATTGQACDFQKPKRCNSCPLSCETAKVEDVVRVYDIDTLAQDWENFWASGIFHLSDPAELHDLKLELAPVFSPKSTLPSRPDT
jgi:hypothetical protein